MTRMARAESAVRCLYLTGAIAVLITAGGCENNVSDDNVMTASLAEMQSQVRSQAASIATGLGVDLPEATRVGPAPCESPSGDLSKDGRYSVTGNWQVPLPKSKQRATFQQIRSAWLAAGFKITSYKELPDGVRANVSAQDPATGFELFIGSAEPPEAVALAITTPCVMSPDHKYPG
jgi:hypothetical protein